MQSKRLYMVIAIMAFLSAPLVFLSWGGGIAGMPRLLLYSITPALEIFVLAVISAMILPPHKRSALFLRVIAVFIALMALSALLMTRDTSIHSNTFLLGTIALILLFLMYTILLSHLQKFNDPALKLLKIYCTLRICGNALLMLAVFLTFLHVAAQIVMGGSQIALGIMLLRYARQTYIPEDGNQDEDLELPQTNHA